MSKHRGEILKKVFEDEKVKISPVARKLGIDRATVYRHFDDRDLSLDYIVKYGHAINHDFSKEFPEIMKLIMDPPSTYMPKKSYEELREEVDMWKDKYLDLLERYNKIIENRLESITKD